MNISEILSQLALFYSSPVALGIVIVGVVFIILSLFLEYFPHSRIGIIFDLLYDKVANFYWDILGENSWPQVRTYIVTLFFVILIANIVGVIVDFIAPVFGVSSAGDFFLAQYVVVPTADMQFNLALAVFSTLLLLYIQFGSLGTGKFLYSYFPVWGKGYIVVEQGKMSKLVYYPVATIAKVGDIVISLFLGFLDVVGLLAKIISLSFRLFGNMTSGTILLGMLIVGTTSMSNALTGFIGGVDLPIIPPIIVYLQSFLVACIQAMVFPLLVAIFIRMAQMDGEASPEVEVS